MYSGLLQKKHFFVCLFLIRFPDHSSFSGDSFEFLTISICTVYTSPVFPKVNLISPNMMYYLFTNGLWSYEHIHVLF